MDFGITSYEFKKWLGCELHPAAYLCDHLSNSFVSAVKKPFAALIEHKIGTSR